MGKLNPIAAGSHFNHLTVLGPVGTGIGGTRYLCRCDCGTEKILLGAAVRAGKVKSCGCARREHAARLGRDTPVRHDHVGQTFGRLTVVEKEPHTPGKQVRWICSWSCGKTVAVIGSGLRNGNSKSCGCARNEWTAARNLTHGQTIDGKPTREYRIWASMHTRCGNPNSSSYSRYGGRGISICARWSSFENFFQDLGPIPTPLSIDRIDNDGNYEPGNVRLATPTEQARNKRRKGGRINT